MIDIQNLTVRYGSVPALSDFSLTVEPGECLLITGPSGCGKSTLAKAISGLIPQVVPAQMSGLVRVAGLNTREHPLASLAQRVGIVFQNPASQLFHLSVLDEVAFGPRNLGLPEREVYRRVAWALEATRLTPIQSERPASLSGGLKQRVALAAALAMRPQVLVLDEPTASLDVPGTQHIMQALQELRNRYGVTIVLIEHRLADALRLADRVALMVAGQLKDIGPPETVLSDRVTRERLGLRRPTETALAPWRTLLASNGPPPTGVTPLIELRGVSAGYDHRPVIEDINLSLYPGDFVALVGDNGAGKSTLALVAAGLRKPRAGRLLYREGKRVRPGLDVGLLFQNPTEQLFTNSVDEEVAFGPHNYRLFDSDWHDCTLAEADLSDLRDRSPLRLSTGQQQRTALASCVALRPHLLILDEPTLGQDWGHLQRLMDFLSSLNRSGTTILLITHDYKLVHHYANRVILMEDGRVTLDGSLKREFRKVEHALN